MKNVLRVVFCLSLVFVLSKLEMGKGTIYFKADGTTTTNISEAYEFENIHDVYECQIEHDGWNIVAK